MRNKYITSAVRTALSKDVIEKGAKANGIYVAGDRLDTFTGGLVTGVYAMARSMGMKSEAIDDIINDIWGDENE